MEKLQLKRNMLIKALKKYDFLECFEEIKEEDHINFFHKEDICQNSCLLAITIDDSICSTITILFATLNDMSKKEKVLDLINTLNEQYRICKYIMNDEGSIAVQVSYIASNDKFDPGMIFTMMAFLYEVLEEHDYAKFMKIMWS